jgi:ATP-binding cassette subfamily F protein 3
MVAAGSIGFPSMAIVTLHGIHKSFGSDVVLDGLHLQLHAGEKVGMIGANGSGKSTILKLILGQFAPDLGEVIKSKGLRIGYLPQESTFDGNLTVWQEIHTGLESMLRIQQRIEQISHELADLQGNALQSRMKEYDRLVHEFELAGGYQIETRVSTTLAALGFDPALYHVKTSALSGGQLSRLGLAKVLMLETDLLLLDEPTNHLDLQATEWLERFLAGYAGAAVLISHDRYLLDQIACRIIEVENHQAYVWTGNYSTYVQTRETVRLQQQREHTRRAEMIERTLDFIARNKDQEGMRGTAKGRKTRLKRLLKQNPDFLEKPLEGKTIQFSFAQAQRKGDIVLRCQDLRMAFGDLVLFDGLGFDLLAGERLGVTGPNGTGKSTLLKLALGQLTPSAGMIRLGPNYTVGFLDQHGDVLDPDRTVLEEAVAANPALSPEQARSRLGAFLLSGDDVFKRTGDLSGGERNRLMLCRLVLSSPDVLILDEPTNHLDIASREMLEQALDEFEGAMVVVSHDRYFLDRVVDKLLVIGTDECGNRQLGRIEFVSGDPVYSAYASLVQRRRQQREQKEETQVSAPKKRRSSSAQEKPRRKAPEELKRFNKYTVDQIEKSIMDLEQEIAELKERFGDSAVYKNTPVLIQLQQDLAARTTELDLLYRAYEFRSQ